MGYTLIIAEKPDAARRIAEALADKKPKVVRKREVEYYEFTVNGKKHVCVPAVGHLFTLSPLSKSKKWNYPIFSYEWTPTYTKKGTEWTKKYFENIVDLAKGADEFIDAADVDTEGEVLLYNILRFICKVKDAKRMQFSTLTKDELVEAYRNMSNHILFPMLESGLTRHELDWLWGINLTRALTLALKNHSNKAFAILSAGRVQSPTLNLLLEREIEIRNFKPKPFWQLELRAKVDNQEIIAIHEKDKFWKKEEVDKVLNECKGKDALVKDVKKREYKQKPPFPFNTTDLQAEAYACFKFSPTQTLQIAESLYQQGFISYPRSSSQKLPPVINYEKILKALASLKPYEKFAKELLEKEKLVPNEGPRCVTGDTLIPLSNGEIVTIKEIVEKGGTNVLGINDRLKIIQEKILERYKFPAEKVIGIKLANNEEVFVTFDHPILTLVEGEMKWTEAKNIRSGMVIATPEKITVHRQKRPSTILEIFDLFDPVEQKKILICFKKSFKSILREKARVRKLIKEICSNFNLNKNTVKSYLQRCKLPYLIVRYLLEKRIIGEEKIRDYVVGYTYASGGSKIIKLPFYLSKDFLYFIGFIAADGHNTGREIIIDNLPKEKKVFTILSKKIFGLKAKNYKDCI
ncbi:MAG: DNA topoisomerase, partial [Candidatus Aenigmatarchaeota archaeon]